MDTFNVQIILQNDHLLFLLLFINLQTFHEYLEGFSPGKASLFTEIFGEFHSLGQVAHPLPTKIGVTETKLNTFSLQLEMNEKDILLSEAASFMD